MIERRFNQLVGRAAFPAICEVCEGLDLTVVQDIDGEPGKYFPVLGIGAPAEPFAGLHSYYLSPFFRTTEELEQWCAKYLPQLRPWFDRDELPPPEEREKWT